MDPAPSPRRDSTSGMLPPSSPRRNSASTPTRTTQPSRQSSPGPTSSPHAHNAPPHVQPQRRYRPKHYDGNPIQAHTPSSSVDGDLDAISELEVPAGTSPYLNYHGQTSGHGYGHGPHHNYHTQSDPPTRSPRNLVICLDGTHNSFCDHNSNVVRLFELLEKSDRQLCYYDSGVGTQQGPWLYGLKKDFAMVTDLAFAWNFKTHVIDAYRFVMDQYQDGDKIWIFGFSRGSYAARALSGMLQYVGLLPKGNHSQVPLAWSIYAASADIPFTDSPFSPSPKHTKVKQPGRSSQYAGTPEEYKRIFSRSVHIPIEFVGVWDTVSALGITKLPNLPFASAIGYVRYFRQALSLDERRAKFVPEYYHEECEPSEEGKGTKAVTTEKQVLRQRDNGYLRVKEVWFLGCHSDVGGGNTINGQPALSNISLRWMVFEASILGLEIDNNALFSSRIYNNPKYPTVRRLIPPRYISVEDFTAKPIEDEDFLRYRSQSDDTRAKALIRQAAEWDAEPNTPLDKNLPIDLRQEKQESLRGFYWLLEWAWLERWDYVGGNRRKLVKNQNWGKGREIIEQQRIHRSVYNRLQYELQQKDAKTTLIQEVKIEIKKTFLSKKQKKKLDQEKEIQWPKAGFADGTTWEQVLGKGPNDDIWETVEP